MKTYYIFNTRNNNFFDGNGEYGLYHQGREISSLVKLSFTSNKKRASEYRTLHEASKTLDHIREGLTTGKYTVGLADKRSTRFNPVLASDVVIMERKVTVKERIIEEVD